MVQTFVVYADDPTITKIKAVKALTTQLVPPYARTCRENKKCENFFWSLWWHFCKSLHQV